ncbi:hypothetical protein [Mycobacteroides abscessus]|uniref:hypothetical protein n=1 Tax=Mycobacteroides abscessus TaxID=36809 RepID=UPI0009A8FF58|nr:hypothetical protein [Mycobacteroides abscessus]SKK26081.1 Uncharacterised protein [Mycobacteroides abscessus subsp. massiliense]SKK29177.1 Uncharacterised protein [Mycobacteroides abscessus subsp. massiliense]SKK51202.1 Uncharacterised protein [Mycobacteroides abscessus subsp. massiliense]
MSTEEDKRQPSVGFENVEPGDLARAKAAIEGFKGRFERGEVSPAEVNRVFAGVGAATGRLFVDELSAADIAAAEAGGVPDSGGEVVVIEGYENTKPFGDLRIMSEVVDGEPEYFVAEVFYDREGRAKSWWTWSASSALSGHTDVDDLRRVIAKLQDAGDKPVLDITADGIAE